MGRCAARAAMCRPLSGPPQASAGDLAMLFLQGIVLLARLHNSAHAHDIPSDAWPVGQAAGHRAVCQASKRNKTAH